MKKMFVEAAVTACCAALAFAPVQAETLRLEPKRSSWFSGVHVCRDGKTLDAARVKEWAGVPFKTPGISATQMEGWRSVYAYDYKLFTPESLTKIASDAGVHLYLDKPATVFAKEGFLAVHTKDGGEKTVRLRTKAVQF